MDNDRKMNKTEEQWKSELTPDQYRVLREKGTEAAFTGKYYENYGAGMYMCGACGAPLFSSKTKFNSGSGWPSFWEGAQEGSVEFHSDTSHGMSRVEVVCGCCNSHLGHIFDDGPKPTGKRYCINSCALDFKKNEAV